MIEETQDARTSHTISFVFAKLSETWKLGDPRHGGNMKHVYFITGGGKTKIGLSEAPLLRLTTLRANSPVPLKLIGTFPGTWRIEHALHEQYADYHSHGEWFDLTFTPAIIEEIRLWVEARQEEARQIRATFSSRVAAREAPEHCSLPGCDRPYKAKGLCMMHYMRARKTPQV